jgi:shikimate kinase
MNVILFGFKKCGKTYYGLKVASKLHMNFIDSDHLIEDHYFKLHHHQLTYREIAKKHGFKFFRDLEKHVVSTLTQVKNSVISLGGGVVLNPENVDRLKQIGVFIYLRTPKETLKHRILSHEPPAFFDPDHPLASFEKMYEERLPIYEQIPSHWVETEHATEEIVVDRICHIIQKVKEQQHGK